MKFVLDEDFEGTAYEQMTEEEKEIMTKELDTILDKLARKGFDEETIMLFVKKIFPDIYRRYNFRFCITIKN